MPQRPGYRRKDYKHSPSMNKKGPQAGEPFSKWQILVEETRTEKCLAIRALAEICLIPSGTLFNWLRAKTGVPSFTRYKPPVNKRIADALGIKPDTLWEAYQHSLKHIPSPPGPAPRSQGNPPAGNSGLQEDVTPLPPRINQRSPHQAALPAPNHRPKHLHHTGDPDTRLHDRAGLGIATNSQVT